MSEQISIAYILYEAVVIEEIENKNKNKKITRM